MLVSACPWFDHVSSFTYFRLSVLHLTTGLSVCVFVPTVLSQMLQAWHVFLWVFFCALSSANCSGLISDQCRLPQYYVQTFHYLIWATEQNTNYWQVPGLCSVIAPRLQACPCKLFLKLLSGLASFLLVILSFHFLFFFFFPFSLIVALFLLLYAIHHRCPALHVTSLFLSLFNFSSLAFFLSI